VVNPNDASKIKKNKIGYGYMRDTKKRKSEVSDDNHKKISSNLVEYFNSLSGKAFDDDVLINLTPSLNKITADTINYEENSFNHSCCRWVRLKINPTKKNINHNTEVIIITFRCHLSRIYKEKKKKNILNGVKNNNNNTATVTTNNNSSSSSSSSNNDNSNNNTANNNNIDDDEDNDKDNDNRNINNNSKRKRKRRISNKSTLKEFQSKKCCDGGVTVYHTAHNLRWSVTSFVPHSHLNCLGVINHNISANLVDNNINNNNSNNNNNNNNNNNDNYNARGISRILSTLNIDSEIGLFVKDILTNHSEVSNAFVAKKVRERFQTLLTVQALQHTRVKLQSLQQANMASGNFNRNIKALLDYLKGFSTFKVKFTKNSNDQLKSLLIVDVLAINEFALAPELMMMDYTSRVCNPVIPLVFFCFVNSNKNYVPLAIAFTEDEVYHFIFLLIYV
jgi:hypothetical protein